jgi:hypothetical protein
VSTMANPTPATQAQIDDDRRLLERAREGDESAVPRLRELLLRPGAVEGLGGDLARQAELAFAHRAAGKDLRFREALLRKADLLRAELAGPSPTPVERLLAERVVACWLQVHDADFRYAQSRGEPSGRASEGCHQRRMDGAHRRYLSALRTLALVRKLAVPLLQVNIAANQQVNLGAEPGQLDR